ncbi:MAG: nucleotidyltransferase family protein [Clostridia bacterium]|nr:nucleotidyltransferase family protein [Clostridia bacterium]
MEQKISTIFFELIRHTIIGEDINNDVIALITPDILPALFTLSKRHDLAHLIGDALDKNGLLPKKSKEEKLFLNERNMAFYRLASINYEYERLCSVLEKLHVNYLPLKGLAIRYLYPQKWMRTSADIDVLLNKSDLELVVNELVKTLNYTSQETDAYNTIMVSPNGVHVELHFDLIAKCDSLSSNKILSNVWKNVTKQENSYCYKMSGEYFYFYHVAHMARHMFKGGCGIKPFIDLWLINEKYEFNKEKANALLEEGGLIKFENACYTLSKIWLENEEYTKEATMLKNFVIDGGVFGSSQNEVLINQGKKGGRAKYILSRIFMPVEEMQHRYNVLKKHKWLYPIFVVLRCFEVVFKGDSKRIKNELKTSAQITSDKQQNIENLIDYLGLKN